MRSRTARSRDATELARRERRVGIHTQSARAQARTCTGSLGLASKTPIFPIVYDVTPSASGVPGGIRDPDAAKMYVGTSMALLTVCERWTVPGHTADAPHKHDANEVLRQQEIESCAHAEGVHVLNGCAPYAALATCRGNKCSDCEFVHPPHRAARARSSPSGGSAAHPRRATLRGARAPSPALASPTWCSRSRPPDPRNCGSRGGAGSRAAAAAPAAAAAGRRAHAVGSFMRAARSADTCGAAHETQLGGRGGGARRA